MAKGSLKNKLILVPAALAISAFIPWLITPLLMIGGAYLCFEGVEKLAHDLVHHADELVSQLPVAGSILSAIKPLLMNAIIGIAVGVVVLSVFNLIMHIKRKMVATAS